MSSRLRFIAAFAVAAMLSQPVAALSAAPPIVTLPDLDGRLVDPFVRSKGAKAIVLLFTSVDCPISNRYAPVVARLQETYGPKGVAFWLIYPNASESPERIRAHIEAFGHRAQPLRDLHHELAKLAAASVTPETALFDGAGRLVYHGRIDDRYVSLGLERAAPTRHDLEEALSATLAGKPVRQATAPAVGCFIE